MKLVLKGHDERYVVEQGMLNLFPGERPVYEPIGPEDNAWAKVSLEEEADRCAVEVELSWRGMAATHRLDAPLAGDEFQREGLRRRAIGRCFFLAACEATGKTPPWGMLTGVRPVKLPTREMAAGATPEQARASLERDCYVSPERAKLAVDCAQASLNAQRTLKEDEVSLYVGIPFCPTRCAYCSFVSQSVEKSLGLVEPYLDVLCREITDAAQMVRETGLRIKSFYMGGGTPTTLTAEQMDRVLTAFETSFDRTAFEEITVEAGRPDTITAEKLAVLRTHGVTRVSVNPQTFEENVLRAIGRCHTAADIDRAMELVARCGFPHVNMDLIAGLPEDTAEGFRRSLEGVLEMEPENVTIHTLALKKGSALMERGVSLPSGAEVAEMLDFSREILIQRGYRPYYLYRQKYMSGALENVGWAKPGTENLYNIIMMEELQTVVSVGGGGATKLVDHAAGRIVRLPNPKYPHDYLTLREKVLAQKEELVRFYGPAVP